MKRIFRRIQKDYFREYLRTVKIYSLYFPSVESFSVLSRILLILFGAYWVSINETSISVVIAFLLYSPMFFYPLKELSEQYNVLQAAFASSERIFSLLTQDSFIKDSEDVRPNQHIKGKIEFINVSFAYQPEQPVLKNVSFVINPGEKVALVGLSGSGKSTIISLINRFYDIQDGIILIDDLNIKQYRKKELRSWISLVLQDVFIFSDTIKENIRLFDQNISDKKIIKAAEHVHAQTFIKNLSQKYNSKLGERGVGLSYGEKQLLSFARAFIHDSKIVIFDEATSNIDLKTEALIQENLKDLCRDKSAIIIAHRLSTIKQVDKIIVLHQGEIKEIGSHHELLQQKGYYEKLYQLQFED